MFPYITKQIYCYPKQRATTSGSNYLTFLNLVGSLTNSSSLTISLTLLTSLKYNALISNDKL